MSNDDLLSLLPKVEFDRRAFVVTSLAAGFAVAVQPVTADTIKTDSEGIEAGEVKIPVTDGQIPAYRAMPNKGGPFPVVLVVQEIFGVHEHIKDVCRRFAKLGYLAIAPEMYARQGDVSKIADIQEVISKVVSKVPDAQVMSDLDATVAWAKSTGKADVARLAITGFCWGGRVVWLYAAHNPSLKAGVAWYGRLVGPATPLTPKHPIDVVGDLKAPVLGLYGENDKGISLASVDQMKAKLKEAKKPSEIILYPDTDHGFHADYRPTYQPKSATDGWKRLLDWFKKNGVLNLFRDEGREARVERREMEGCFTPEIAMRHERPLIPRPSPLEPRPQSLDPHPATLVPNPATRDPHPTSHVPRPEFQVARSPSMLIGEKRWAGLLLVAMVGPAWAGTPLDERVDSVLKAKGFVNGQWGLLVVDSTSGKVVYERDADRMFCPASVTKLFSTASALLDLGADYRFKTPVVRKGEVKDGTLHGDLILVARGDLSLGGRTGPDGSLMFEDNDHSYADGNANATLVPGDPLAGLTHLAREVHASGIKAITGDVLVDDRMFDHAQSTGSGPTRVSPIMINDNVIDVITTPAARAGESAMVRIVPETTFVSVDARVETTTGGQAHVEVHAEGPRRFSVRGHIPINHKPVVKITEVEEPAAFARSLFIQTLRNRGVVVTASPLGDNASSKLPPTQETASLPSVAVYTSPPFRESLKVILKVSQNLHASTLPMLVAAHHGERTLERGLKLEGENLARLGVDVKTISFGGGAGGSRSDLVTPRATVALLRAMSTRADFNAYDAALPVLGRDGTLAMAVASDSPARGHARAKTGTYWVGNGLDGHSILASKALAGYLETAAGKKLVFAFFVNNIPVEALGNSVAEVSTVAGQRLGKLCEIFYADGPDSTETAPQPDAGKSP